MAFLDLPGVRGDYKFTVKPGAGVVFTYPASAPAHQAGKPGSLIGYDGCRFWGDVWKLNPRTAELTPPSTIPAVTGVSQAQADAAFSLGWNACLDAMAKLRK